ncbi:uncharacterized protein LOC109538624 [Dendroctonus ponderosae]|uniref:EamA domain-containing protein n=1 Tax=Dendroctonus ponderosae TaxID=77166 RepID=U4UAR8_DENPD|nr:uncharacterized protein LOC109538624 [Dendroctonus ponderosae]ERL87055.1 hypothetical protein D910_04456 [Dendroctonus ponderosae]KAH1024738.1 hypothetical protein HUJ05_004181 [Dendroctonus ponderosae]
MEDDHEELLQYSDDESVSETQEEEDNVCPVEPEDYRHLAVVPHSKLEFFSCFLSLILSSTVLLIILPLYISAINVEANVYSILAFNAPLATALLGVVLILLKYLCGKCRTQEIFAMPVGFRRLLELSGLYIGFCYLYMYASDRNRVLCHMQDPIKGIIVVFALLNYFFFCRSFMGLHRIFSTTTVIVGLFISVDYGLCDEFVCRGYDRAQLFDDTGSWSWQVHSIWTQAYIFSLILIAAFYTLLDRCVVPSYSAMPSSITSPPVVNTISITVTGNSSNLEQDVPEQDKRVVNPQLVTKSAVLFAFWIHVMVCALMLLTFWVDFIPGIGKGHSAMESLNFTKQGLMCHFTSHAEALNCQSVFWYSVGFQIAYVLFAISSIKFLTLTQSAVFTIATMSSALPIIGIWWTLFHASPSGALVWAPKVRGEFICSIIGLPIVFLGLGLLCKAHFKDVRKLRPMVLISVRS